MNWLNRQTLGWYQRVLGATTLVSVLAWVLLIVAGVSFLAHYLVVRWWAAQLADFSIALVGFCGALIALMGLYGIMRGVAFHPVLGYRYHEWLRQTPWRPGLPLPGGSIAPTWQDSVLLGVTTLIVASYAPQLPRPEQMILGPAMAMLAGLAVSWTVANYVTRNLLAVYAAAIAWPVVTLAFADLEASAGALGLAAAAVVAYTGVAVGLHGYPWDVQRMDKAYVRQLFNPSGDRGTDWQQDAVVGWPYAQLLMPPKESRAPWTRTLLEAATVGVWFAYGIRAVGFPFDDLEGLLWPGTIGLAIVKLVGNSLVICPDFCLGERVAKRRPIVWEHDRLLIEPLLAAGMFYAFGAGWMYFGLQPTWLGAALTAAVGAVALRRIGRPIERAFCTGPRVIRGHSPQRPHFERLAASGD